MPILATDDYRPSLIFRNGDINTLFPFVFRKCKNPKYKRTRFETSDDDFIDLDLLQNNKERLVIICHGLEGNSDSQYLQNMAAHLYSKDWDVLCINFRSCGGEINRKLPMYHSGFTSDVHEVISAYQNQYSSISLIGFSLGGNVILKYISDGIYNLSKTLVSAVAISVPIDLSKCSEKISTRANWIYDKRFRVSLEKKIREKHKCFPNEVDLKYLSQVKKLRDFDEYYTAPLHGFDGAEDYYSKCNSKQFLNNISLPTLLITALDDPFLTQESFPFSIAADNNNFYFLAPKFGGHVGFTTFGTNYYWHENKTLQFINDPDLFGTNHEHITNWM